MTAVHRHDPNDCSHCRTMVGRALTEATALDAATLVRALLDSGRWVGGQIAAEDFAARLTGSPDPEATP